MIFLLRRYIVIDNHKILNLKLLDFAKIKYDITESSDIHYSPNFGIILEQYMSEH